MFNFWKKKEVLQFNPKGPIESEKTWQDIVCFTPRDDKKVYTLSDYIKSSSKIGESLYYLNQDGVPISREERLAEFLQRNPISVSSLNNSSGESEIYIFDGMTRMTYAIMLNLPPGKITMRFGDEVTTLDILIKRSLANAK